MLEQLRSGHGLVLRMLDELEDEFWGVLMERIDREEKYLYAMYEKHCC